MMDREVMNVLVLGTSTGAEDAIRYMKSLGAHVTVTDNARGTHPAKDIADSVRNVSTQDFYKLVEICVQEEISGVFSGVNEANIRMAIRLSEELSLPYFCTMGQWDRLMDKGQFRELSREVGLPAPLTYYSGDAAGAGAAVAEISFPCIVKPADSSALRGISVCQSATELAQAIHEANGASRTGRVIIEEFVDGDEFTAAYVVVDGRAALSSVDDRYPLVLEGMTTSFPALRVYPSRHTSTIADQCDGPVQAVCDLVGLKNCCLFVQGIISDGRVAVFEAGLRLAAETPYRFLREVNGVNQLHHYVDASLGLTASHAIEQEDPYLGGDTCAILSFVGRGGVIDRIEGLDEVLISYPQIVTHELRHEPGKEIPYDGSLRQIVLRLILRCSALSALERVIEDVTRRIRILDEKGESLALSVDSSVIHV